MNAMMPATLASDDNLRALLPPDCTSTFENRRKRSRFHGALSPGMSLL